MIPHFNDFIEAKPLYYKEIDYTRIHVAYALLKPQIRHPKTVHIVGTNGKGTTGRVLAYAVYKSGLSVGHFSSPHILRFNERIWLNGEESSDATLESAHQKLYAILGQEVSEGLSYFEYTTLLALVVFEALDLIVLEAGLGGEHDATNVCDKALSIITPIGLDHQAFLGDNIEQIATTKINSIQTQMLLAPQVYDEVVQVAQKICAKKGAVLHDASVPNDELKALAKQKGWSGYLTQNASVALEALKILGIAYDVEDLKALELFGRFYPLTSHIRIDVGHNPLAALALEQALDEKVVLIYNSLDDKDYETVLRFLKPKIKRVLILPIETQRAATLSEIEKALQGVGIPYGYFDGTLDEAEQYLVFGSFYVVEAFLKRFDGSK